MDENQLFNNLLNYVKENHSWSNEEHNSAVNTMDMNRCSLSYANYSIYTEIEGLIDEYCEENSITMTDDMIFVEDIFMKM